jgi:SPP1 family phage portal protein
MDAKELDEIIKKHKPLSTRTYDQKTYKIGLNAGIFQESPKPDPDNRIPVPFVRRALKIVKGYFAKVGNITYSDESGWFEKYLKPIFDANNEEMETAVMFEDSVTYGAPFELHWFDVVDGLQFAPLPVDQSIPVYSDDLKPKLTAFVWLRKSGNEEIATWYSDKEYQEFRKSSKAEKPEWILDTKRSGIHLYGRVPVIEANIDRDKRNMFDPVLPLIDAYDKLISSVANEHEKFENSILLLRNYLDTVTKDENGLTAADKVKMWRTLDQLGDNVRDSAAYLERNVNDTFINNTLDRFERLIYEMLCIFNPNDNSFATASGIAQAYKLLGFELLVSDMESYFSQFLQARIKLIAGHGSGRIQNKENASFVTIHFERDLPFDVETMARIALILSGGKQVLSMESIIKLFPSTKRASVEEEMTRIKEERVNSPDPFAIGA